MCEAYLEQQTHSADVHYSVALPEQKSGKCRRAHHTDFSVLAFALVFLCPISTFVSTIISQELATTRRNRHRKEHPFALTTSAGQCLQ